MPQLGESVTEGTVTRWLKKEGERVEVDEPLLEVSTDKVDTEIPSPASGILRDIAVDEDETVAVGAQLAVIEETDAAPAPASGDGQDAAAAAPQASVPVQDAAEPSPAAADAASAAEPETAPSASSDGVSSPPGYAKQPAAQTPGYAPPPAYGQPPDYGPPAAASASPDQAAAAEEYPPSTPLPGAGEAPYVTPLVRKLAAEHAVSLESVTGTGVGGRIRKQDVIEAARTQRGQQATEP